MLSVMITRYSSESLYQFCLSNLNGTTNSSSVDLCYWQPKNLAKQQLARLKLFSVTRI